MPYTYTTNVKVAGSIVESGSKVDEKNHSAEEIASLLENGTIAEVKSQKSASTSSKTEPVKATKTADSKKASTEAGDKKDPEAEFPLNGNSSRPQVIAYAKEHGIEVDQSLSRDEMIAVIKEASTKTE